MKFENDYWRVIIEKKQLTPEQKEEQRIKRRKRLPVTVTALVVVTAILAGTLYNHFYVPKDDNKQELAAATNTAKETTADSTDVEVPAETTRVEGTYVTSARLATSIQEKYKDKGLYDYTYGEAIDSLGRGDGIELKLNFNPVDTGKEDWTEIYAIYQDPELTKLVHPNYNWDKETSTLTLTPPNYAINKISIGQLDTEMVNKYQHSQLFLFDNGDGADWGNLGTLYLACYYDQETGKPLEEPEVRIINIEGELKEAPQLDYSILEDGRPQFTWTPVEGAEEYIVCEATYDPEKGYDSNIYPLGVTSETKWTTEAPEYGRYSSVNTTFKIYRVSEDAWKDETYYEIYAEDYEPNVVALSENVFGDPQVCVVAICKDGTSMISNTFSYSEMAPNLPHSTASYTEKENGFTNRYETVEELPSYDYITMCDGITNMKVINYKTEEATVTSERFINIDENGEYINGENIICLNVPYDVDGTPFSYTMEVLYYDEANLQKDMKFLEDREDKLRKKSGDIAPEVAEEEEETPETENTDVRQVEDVEIFANSALTEYLAANMLGGATYVDLSAFPEAKDTAFAGDALLEAYYQNPLILGIKSYRVNRKGTAVRIFYENTPEEQARKQEEIKQKVTEVISEIITDDMTDEEKELAINQYMCETMIYDEDALLNAEENDFVNVDEEFNDSFNAYGALLNGKCVCAGYSAAFKLLAEAAGLDSIVVTGVLDGGLSHAWNKVKIDDEWQIVDVTNNDNDYIMNALLNLPASVGDRVLVEDKEYMIDKAIPQYTGESDEYEYYHRTDSFFPTQDIAEKLAEGLTKDGTVTLRTEYDLNDEQFYEITDAVYGIIGEEVNLYGYYWIGVIYLSTDESAFE